MIFTDEWKGLHRQLGPHYAGHKRIRHQDRIYVSGDVHTPRPWRVLRQHEERHPGVYHSVSSRHLPSYLNEYCFRYNERQTKHLKDLRRMIVTSAETEMNVEVKRAAVVAIGRPDEMVPDPGAVHPNLVRPFL